MGDVTTIPLSKATRDRLRALGRKGETYDQLLNRLIDDVEKSLPPTAGRERPLVSFEAVDE